MHYRTLTSDVKQNRISFWMGKTLQIKLQDASNDRKLASTYL